METKAQGQDVSPNDAKRVLPAVFESGTDKKNKFHSELKALLAKYDAEIDFRLPFLFSGLEQI